MDSQEVEDLEDSQEEEDLEDSDDDASWVKSEAQVKQHEGDGKHH